MNVLILSLVMISGVLLFGFWLRRRAKQNGTGAKEELAGICRAALDQTVRKQANKRRITELLGERGQLSNADIRIELGVTDRTVVRYMNELEKEGVTEQVGDTGRGVVYRLR